jgi:hypothetical protein
MMTIAQALGQVTKAVADLRAAGLDVHETNINWWLTLPESQRRQWRQVKEA